MLPPTNKPITSVVVSGTMRQIAAAKRITRSGLASAPPNQPSVEPARNQTPIAPVKVACKISMGAPFMSNTGLKKNMKGTKNVARPIFRAIQDVFQGSALHIPAAAKEASATGGVIAEITAK